MHSDIMFSRTKLKHFHMLKQRYLFCCAFGFDFLSWNNNIYGQQLECKFYNSDGNTLGDISLFDLSVNTRAWWMFCLPKKKFICLGNFCEVAKEVANHSPRVADHTLNRKWPAPSDQGGGQVVSYVYRSLISLCSNQIGFALISIQSPTKYDWGT